MSRKTGYKWLNRYKIEGIEGLKDKSKRPKCSPQHLPSQVEDQIIRVRKDNPEWGAKKIIVIMKAGAPQTKANNIPALSTIDKVLKRNGLIREDKSIKSQRWQRFEHPYPNALWQMDFKGYSNLIDHSICYPLTILDDHSRFNIGLFACRNEKYLTV